jgi:hypothetical protein
VTAAPIPINNSSVLFAVMWRWSAGPAIEDASNRLRCYIIPSEALSQAEVRYGRSRKLESLCEFPNDVRSPVRAKMRCIHEVSGFDPPIESCALHFDADIRIAGFGIVSIPPDSYALALIRIVLSMAVCISVGQTSICA